MEEREGEGETERERERARERQLHAALGHRGACFLVGYTPPCDPGWRVVVSTPMLFQFVLKTNICHYR